MKCASLNPDGPVFLFGSTEVEVPAPPLPPAPPPGGVGGPRSAVVAFALENRLATTGPPANGLHVRPGVPIPGELPLLGGALGGLPHVITAPTPPITAHTSPAAGLTPPTTAHPMVTPIIVPIHCLDGVNPNFQFRTFWRSSGEGSEVREQVTINIPLCRVGRHGR